MGSEQQAALTQKSLAISGTASCVKCGYSLAGLPHSGACPECATAVAKSVGPLMGTCEMVTFKAACIRCGYNLTGLPYGGHCPECGVPMAESVGIGPPVSEFVTAPAACITCGYALMGLPVAGKCPECGTDVANSLRGSLLRFAGQDYLTKLRVGLSFVLTSILLAIVLSVAGFFVRLVLDGEPAKIGAFALVVLQPVVAALGWWGYWNFTQLDPASGQIKSERSSRRVVRGAVVAQAVGVLLSLPGGLADAGVGILPTSMNQLATVIFMAGHVTMYVAWVVQFFATMKYLGLMAKRVPDALMITRSKRYLWILPLWQTVGMLLVGLGPLIALIMYWNILHRMRKHIIAALAGEPRAKLPGVDLTSAD